MLIRNKVLADFPGVMLRVAAELPIGQEDVDHSQLPGGVHHAGPTDGFWGYHLVLDCGGCDVGKMKDEANVRDWITKLVPAIDMKPIGPPRIEYTASQFPDKAGFTVVQVIVTSDITAHFVDNLAQIYVDVFSCKAYDQRVVEDSIRTHFGAKKMRKYFLTRQAD